ncbi:hypothetical protein CYMTET_26290, partial [Cymbomonas tetramitiformis]
MGNQLAQPLKQPAQPSEYVSEVPDLVYKDNLGGGRFLKTLRCVHEDGGAVVVKVYFKREDSPDLKTYERRLLEIKRVFSDPPLKHQHVWPFQRVVEIDKAAYLLRQYLYSNLHDRLRTRPFLSNCEKKWLAFQLLHAVAQSHERGICHGDIKLENVILTSWNWAFLTDFASFKPTSLPADNPADYSFFYDTGGRRRCYIAPERFYEHKAGVAAGESELTPAADVFSVGCCIAELFLEGQALFDLSQLLAYRRAECDPTVTLSKIKEPGVMELVLHMIHLEPSKRLSSREYLSSWGPRLFPEYFSPLWHDFSASLLHLDADAKVAALHTNFRDLRASILAAESASASALLTAGALQASDASSGSSGKSAPAEKEQGGKVEAAGEGVKQHMLPDLGLGDINKLLSEAERHSSKLESPQLLAADSLMLSTSHSGGMLFEDVDQLPPQGVLEHPVFVDEVVTEEVYENQVREVGGSFSDRALEGPSARTMVGSGRRREDVNLPPGGQWEWMGPWTVDLTKGGAHGWMYRQPGMGNGGGTTPRGAGGATRWANEYSAECLWRCRLWVRKRKRRMRTAAAAAAAAEGVESGEAATAISWDGEASGGMGLLSGVLCATLRGARLARSKARALSLLCEVAAQCDDDLRLQRVVPYLLAVLAEPHTLAAVRAAALKALTACLSSIREFAPSDSKVFPEYILPSLSLMPRDPEELVRTTYAHCLVTLACTAHRFLEQSQYMDQKQKQAPQEECFGGEEPPLKEGEGKAKEAEAGSAVEDLEMAGGEKKSSRRPPHTASAAGEGKEAAKGAAMAAPPRRQDGVRYDEELRLLRHAMRQVVQDYLTPVDPKSGRSSVAARRSLLMDVRELCRFFGRKESNDLLLPLLITCLNDRDWFLRSTFFEHIAGVGPCVGRMPVEQFLLPCIEQALLDSQEQ